MYNNAIFVGSKDQIPDKQHFAILIFDSIVIPGDERSKSHPGRGYSEHTQTTISYRAYLKEEDWKAAIREMEGKVFGNHNYVALRVNPAKIIPKFDIEIQ